ncbi:hypothetical protein [Aestuariivirga sp.]|uniref:hypothetical protein n=1 Tax=Aestuariivirga sp. TaxID=2650926 RepID=UPI003784EFC7
MADLALNAVEIFSQRVQWLDAALAPDMPDLSRLSLRELDMLFELHMAVTEAAKATCNQPRCTHEVERIVDETETRSWHYINTIALEAASRKPEPGSDDELIRAQITLRALFEKEDLDVMILQLADEIRAGKTGAA